MSTCSAGVWDRRWPTATQYSGPYLVLEKGPKLFKIQMGEREEVMGS